MKSSLDLGTSLSSAMGHSGHEMPPKHSHFCGYEGALLTGTGTSRLPLQRLNHGHYTADLQHSLKGIQGGYQEAGAHSVLWEKGTKQAFR